VLRPNGCLVAATSGVNHLKEMDEWFIRFKTDNDFSAVASPFTLENGLEQLEPFFSQVEIRRDVDNLRITEILPLMAYIRSTSSVGSAPETAFAQLEQELTAELLSKGEIHVTKDSGLFLAIK
jgi:hypothetical protein